MEYSTIPGRPILRSRSYHPGSKGVPRAPPTISLLDLDDQVSHSISAVFHEVDTDHPVVPYPLEHICRTIEKPWDPQLIIPLPITSA